MAKARYSIMVPVNDNVGNKLKDVAAAAHHFLTTNYGIQNSTITRGHQGHWGQYPPEEMDMLWIIAEDTPELDSQTKQVAEWVGDVANQEGVYWIKEGGGHINDAVIWNRNFRQGEGAEPDMIAEQAQGIIDEQSQSPMQGVGPGVPGGV